MSPIAKRPSTPKKTTIAKKPLIAKRPGVSVSLPRGELFVGSFHRLTVKHPSTLSFDDLVFVIPDGPKAGLVSPSRDRLFSPGKPDIMLLVGYEPGTYVLRVLHRVTDDVLFEGEFTVTALWQDQDAGPSLWFTGIVGTPVAGAAWGGGGAGPQNVDVVPASGTRRIAVLLFDTASQRFTPDEPTLQGHRDRWMDELINGVPVDGQTRSVRSYFQEVSYNNFDIADRRPRARPGGRAGQRARVPAAGQRLELRDRARLAPVVPLARPMAAAELEPAICAWDGRRFADSELPVAQSP